jgi:hypothetical protein
MKMKMKLFSQWHRFFRIDVFEQYGKLWVFDLTLINEEDEEWTVLTAHLNN